MAMSHAQLEGLKKAIKNNKRMTPAAREKALATLERKYGKGSQKQHKSTTRRTRRSSGACNGN